MNLRASIVVAAAALFGAVTGGAQTKPKFEVVSIRTVPPNTPPTMRDVNFTAVLPGGRYIDSRAALFFMIAFAYDIPNPSVQLEGLPKWTDTTSFAIYAKPADDYPKLAPAENRERVRLMMQSLLAERFHLRLHTETRRETLFQLEVAKGGPKLSEVDPPAPPAKASPVGAAMSDLSGRMIGNKSTMAGLAGALVIFLRRPVTDGTGLTGYYDFDVKWSVPPPPGDQAASHGFGADGVALLISNLRAQLGLRLQKVKGPVGYWVVDRIEPPTEN